MALAPAAPTCACRSTPTCRTTRRSCPPCSPTSSTVPTSRSAAATCRAAITENWPYRRRLLSRWGNRYAAGLLGLAVNDATAGYRAYRSDGARADRLRHGRRRRLRLPDRDDPPARARRRQASSSSRSRSAIGAPASRRCPAGSSARPPGWCSSCGTRTAAIAAGGGGSPADATPIDSATGAVRMMGVVGARHPARRHGRVLRVGRAAPAARARRPAGRGRRHRAPGRRCGGVLRGPAVRRALGDAVDAGPAAVPACGVPPGRLRRLRRGERRGVRHPRVGTRRSSSRCRSTRRSSTSPGPDPLFGDGSDIGHRIRAEVADELGLSCSVGVAPNKFLAKMASVEAKPRARPEGVEPGPGVFEVRPGQEVAYLHPLPVAAAVGGRAGHATSGSAGSGSTPSATSPPSRRSRCGRRSGPASAERLARPRRRPSTTGPSSPNGRSSRSATRRRSPPTSTTATRSAPRSSDWRRRRRPPAGERTGARTDHGEGSRRHRSAPSRGPRRCRRPLDTAAGLAAVATPLVEVGAASGGAYACSGSPRRSSRAGRATAARRPRRRGRRRGHRGARRAVAIDRVRGRFGSRLRSVRRARCRRRAADRAPRRAAVGYPTSAPSERRPRTGRRRTCENEAGGTSATNASGDASLGERAADPPPDRAAARDGTPRSRPAATASPGAVWSAWRSLVVAAVVRHRAAARRSASGCRSRRSSARSPCRWRSSARSRMIAREKVGALPLSAWLGASTAAAPATTPGLNDSRRNQRGLDDRGRRV